MKYLTSKSGNIGIHSYLGTEHYSAQGDLESLEGIVASHLRELPTGMYILFVQVENEKVVNKWIKR